MKIIDLLTNDEMNKLNNLIDTYKKGNELEISFFSNSDLLTLEKFNQLNSILSIITEKEKYKKEVEHSLDIMLNIKQKDNKNDVLTVYRISITGLDKINEYMSMLHSRKNHLIFSVLIGFIYDKKVSDDNNNIKLIKKVKNISEYIKLDDIYMKVKLDNESSVSKDEILKLHKINSNYDVNDYDIIFRFKERTSFIINKNNFPFRIDLTNSRTSYNINSLEKNPMHNEIELEYIGDVSIIKNKSTFIESLFSISEFIIKSIQQTNNIVTKSISSSVLSKYRNILGIDTSKTHLYGRQPISLEIQHLTEKLPNRYAVTDKADGDRYFLIIIDKHCYLLSTNLIVKDTGIDVSNDEINNTILDGEYIFIPKYNKYLYMVFDCLVYGNKDVRDEQNLLKRLEFADSVINMINNNKNYKYNLDHKIDANNTSKLLEHHKKNIISLYNDIDTVLKGKDGNIIIRRKYFIDSSGLKDNEIFTYSYFLWSLYTSGTKGANGTELKCPYLLDGLIYQPLEQKYVVETDKIKYHDYKWKPPQKNSVDFYIEFERDRATNKIIKAYDNSVTDSAKNKPYVICNLHVGYNVGGVEKPVLFNQENNGQQCYLYVDDEHEHEDAKSAVGDRGDRGGSSGNISVRSEDGKLLQDKTVVEFSYLLTDDINANFRWVPLKTRFDKTESVQKYRKRYGNFKDVALKIWRSINNPILISDFKELGNDNMYDGLIKKFKDRIDYTDVRNEKINDVYYQKKNKIVKEMGAFNNYVKSNLIFTYYNYKYTNHRIKNNVLDIGCGRGGDIQKYFYAEVEYVVGIDPDNNGLFNIADSAVSRYAQLKSKQANVPPMNFINADPTNLLIYDEQVKKIGKMNNDNKILFDKYFSPDKNIEFDRLNASFSIHYLLSDEVSWSNLCTNINKHLRSGGFFIFETFDADRVMNLFKDNDKYSEYYDENGEKKLLYEIVKKYDDINSKKRGVGNAIDVYMSWISEDGVYLTEYLVFKDFIIKSLKEKCNLELVETSSFEEFYNNNKKFLEIGHKEDSNLKNRKFFGDVYAFYGESDFIDKCRKYSFLSSYYIFRKTEPNLDKVRKEYCDPTKRSTKDNEKKRF
jgi:SAM-dependent methyltransferase